MSDIATMRAGLQAALDGITNLRGVAYVTDAVKTNQATVVRKEVDYDLTFGRGADTFNFAVRIYAPRDTEKQSQQFLDSLADGVSLRTVLCTDAVASACGVDYVRVVKCSEVQVATVGVVEYLTEEFTVEIVA